MSGAPLKSARLRLACQMGVFCSEHDFVHGAEAEELREKLEKLSAELLAMGGGGYEYAACRIDQLLEAVDSRDATAYGEIVAKHGKDDEEWAKERGLVPRKKRRKAKP